MIGTTCLSMTDQSRPTMNFGWLTPSSDYSEMRQVVLHEFGHALGLIHEHQNPNSAIHWNKPEVIRELSGPPNHWTRDEIEWNVFHAHTVRETNFTEVDPESIMMYPIPVCWTTDGFSAGWNKDLSWSDRSFINQQYP